MHLQRTRSPGILLQHRQFPDTRHTILRHMQHIGTGPERCYRDFQLVVNVSCFINQTSRQIENLHLGPIQACQECRFPGGVRIKTNLGKPVMLSPP